MKRLFLPSPNHSFPGAFYPGRVAGMAVVAAICLAALPSQAEEKAIDLASLVVGVPANVGATSEVTTDELDSVPVLKLMFPDASIEAWRSNIKLEIPAPAAGNYTVTFHAKAEPAECYIEMRVYDFASKPNREVVGAKSFKLEQDWREFVYDFSIENTETGPVTITWGGLARAGKTISFRDVKLMKN